MSRLVVSGTSIASVMSGDKIIAVARLNDHDSPSSVCMRLVRWMLVMGESQRRSDENQEGITYHINERGLSDEKITELLEAGNVDAAFEKLSNLVL